MTFFLWKKLSDKEVHRPNNFDLFYDLQSENKGPLNGFMS